MRTPDDDSRRAVSMRGVTCSHWAASTGEKSTTNERSPRPASRWIRRASRAASAASNPSAIVKSIPAGWACSLHLVGMSSAMRGRCLSSVRRTSVRRRFVAEVEYVRQDFSRA
jgi:hypothetical protein